ncbi:SNF7 family protein [Penicillium atrosanguineum]|uniref:SNF7 family protein n=1 Tax=Penicillium atrosanguineum TaxID=1132637 RepID=UPI00238EAC72|nr:SNF7 family protein [Penicillium atrosanguineum]KAJ5310170.1 SNF7 family protein [Penicillium atrosanguineum]
MTTFHLDDTANDCQESCSGSVRAQPSQVSPQIRTNTVHFDDQNDSCSTRIPIPSLEQAPNTTVYEGYKFFKADPSPGQKAAWTRVERTKMHLDQSEFYKMVQKRANKVSAAQQYQNLSDTRRAHVNQLIHEQRRSDPNVEWSCVYAKERDRPAKARNAHRNDYETVSMDIILMRRPMKTKSYPRTPMGDLVDLGVPFRLDGDDLQKTPMRSEIVSQERPPELSGLHFVPSNIWQQKDRPLALVQTMMPGHVTQGPLPHPVSVTTPFTRLELGQASTPETFDINARNRHENACNGQTNVDKDGGWSSEASSGEDDDSMIFDQSQSDASSTIEGSGNMDCDYADRLTPQETTYQSRSRSPTHRDANHGSHYRKKSRGRHMERKERYYAWRHYHIDMKGVKNILPAMRARGPGAGNADPKLWEKRYRIQRMDDEEVRSRLIDCEARIEQWERAFEHQTRLLQQNIEESRHLQRSRSFWDFSQVPTHCGCDCPKNGHDEQ